MIRATQMTRFAGTAFLFASAAIASAALRPRDADAAPARATASAPVAMCTNGPTRHAAIKRDAALLFGSCKEFYPAFAQYLTASCAPAAPELVEAFKDSLVGKLKPDFRPAHFAPAGGISEAAQRSMRAYILDGAAIGRLPASCQERKILPGDDTDRSIYEVEHHWRACIPVPDYPTDGEIMAGAFRWAVAIRPHLTPLGVEYLRKFLVCEDASGDVPELYALEHQTCTPATPPPPDAP